jgi:hypothetical protein
MLRIAEHLAAYTAVTAAIWQLCHQQGAPQVATALAALSTVLLVILVLMDAEWLLGAARERREAAASAQAVIEAERLRRRAYDLCASLRLGFDICEGCWAWHPDRATRELDRLRAAVGQFVSTDLGASG